MTKQYKNIKFAVEEGIGRITLARPPVNILNIAMMREINDALNKCTNQRNIVALVFDSAEDCRAFSAGVAVEEHAEDTIFQMLDSFHAIFRNLEQLAKPSVAIVDGPALGGGCELAIACDLIVASDRAKFGQPEIKLGVFPPVAALLLPRVVGDKRAREMMLTGETIEAAEAKSIGLVNRVCSSDDLAETTEQLLSNLKNLSASSLELTKRAIDLGNGKSLDDALRSVEDLYLHELMKTRDATEGINAFIEKRKAAWQNR